MIWFRPLCWLFGHYWEPYPYRMFAARCRLCADSKMLLKPKDIKGFK